MTQQFPNAFEFNEYFLTTILDHLYSSLFGTFLYNTDKERKEHKVSSKTQSLWSFTNSRRNLFLNPMYYSDLESKLTLFPVASIRYMKFWKSYYCRHEGCDRVALKGGACARHGGTYSRKMCSVVESINVASWILLASAFATLH